MIECIREDCSLECKREDDFDEEPRRRNKTIGVTESDFEMDSVSRTKLKNREHYDENNLNRTIA